MVYMIGLTSQFHHLQCKNIQHIVGNVYTFVEHSSSLLLVSYSYFISLSPPTKKKLKIGEANVKQDFLLKIFWQLFIALIGLSPISEKDSTFHRMLFIFMCTSMACLLQDQHEQWKRKPETQCRRWFEKKTNICSLSFIFFL